MSRAPFPFRRFVGDTEGLAKYPGEPASPGREQPAEASGVSSGLKGRRASWLLAGGWTLLSVSLAGIFRSAWVGLLAISVGVLIAGLLEVYDAATEESAK